MVSKKQRLEMIDKLKTIILSIPDCSNINDISLKTSIPTSTIQRYLNKKDLFLELADIYDNVDKLYINVQEWLKEAKINGRSRGGTTSQSRYSYSREENGKFLCIAKKKVLKKRK